MLWWTPAKNQATRGWHAAPPASTCKGTGTLHSHSNQRKQTCKKQKSAAKHRKATFRQGSLFNPCPWWEHALGQRPVISRFTSGCWKDTACNMGHLSVHTWWIPIHIGRLININRLDCSIQALRCSSNLFILYSKISNICRSNWKPQKCDQSSGISAFSAPIVSSSCCIFSSSTSSASAFSSFSSCFSSSCYLQIYGWGEA